MASKEKASKELQDLIAAMVKQAYDEGIKVTELNEMIRECREEIGLCKQEPKVEFQYREATEEELTFKDKVYEFFSREISREEATTGNLKQYGHKISKSAYESNILMFSEIMCAAKMLTNDEEKITNYKIRDILWKNGRYTNYNQLLLDIGYEVKSMRGIAYNKWINHTWKHYNMGFFTSPTALMISGYFQLLAENGIQ